MNECCFQAKEDLNHPCSLFVVLNGITTFDEYSRVMVENWEKLSVNVGLREGKVGSSLEA